MSLANTQLFGAAAALAAAVVLLPTQANAESIVVRASGPSAKAYTPGKKLADNISLTLKAGDVVTLLDGRGTRTLRGPGTFGSTSSPAAGSDTRTSLATLLETKRVMRARTGAVRSGLEQVTTPRSPNLWYVDISQASAVCVADPSNIRLWRPAKDDAATVTIKGANGATADVSFAAGDAVAQWPAALPVTQGAGYSLSWAGLPTAVKISFALMEPGSEGLENMASALISRKCDAQLNLLVETVALPDPAPDL